MITLKLLERNNFKIWNEYVINNEYGTFKHLAEWSLLLEDIYDISPKYYFIKGKNNDITGILPLISRKNLYKYILTTNNCKILKSSDKSDDELLKLIENIKDKNTDNIILEGVTNYNNKWYLNDDNVVIKYELPDSYEKLWDKIGQKKRNMIRKAMKNGLKFMIGLPTIDKIKEFYKIYSKNYRDLGTPVHSIQYFFKQAELFKNNIKIGFVSYKEKYIGTMWLTLFRNEISDTEAASFKKFLYTSLNDFMYFEAFRYGIDSGCTIFNMGRSQKNSGSYNFKKGWKGSIIENNSEISLFPCLSISKSKIKYKIFINIWKKLPVFITNSVGPVIRKYYYLG